MKRMPFKVILISLSGSSKLDYYSIEDSDMSESSEEEPDYIPHVETTLDFRGNIRKLFVIELGLDSHGQNIICSPLSAMIPLAKLLLGAKKHSNSKKELLDALGIKHSYELKSTYKQILKEIEYLKGVQTSLASRIYISGVFKLVSQFKKKSQSIFGSAIELIDTTRPDKVADTVNKWVAEHTNGMINKLLKREDISPSLSLLLVNAIYFKIIELPYQGEQSAMIIVLPNEKNGLPILLRTLKMSYELLNIALMKMKTAHVDVAIPKFKIETTINLKKYYKKMGVKYSLVQEQSGLKKVVKHHTVHISDAVQKAIIEVTETGTVAAAATATHQVLAGHAVQRPRFVADHPFLFYIRAMHEQLFSGIVIKPSEFYD
ncbi:unnamed protein product [Arctia plantaginis]|uniref:Serpin domain-containing protein n=1 Tax=Arctia plantaginis TaxID=874455 RepID=A0A8S1AF00_ARCPL|nr:unnamed protein product [Arctia plantaginis]